MERGIIVTLSGGDRVGKATQAKLLAERLGAKLMSFPDYETITGQLIRACLTGSRVQLERSLHSGKKILEQKLTSAEWWEKSPYHFQCLNNMARLDAQEEIRATLDGGTHIVMDRYDVDALVYGAQDGCRLSWIESLISCLIPSDVVIVLNGPSFSRSEIADCNESDSDFSAAIKRRYLSMAEIYGWSVVHTVDAPDRETSIAGTHAAIITALGNAFIRKFGQDMPLPLITLPSTREGAVPND